MKKLIGIWFAVLVCAQSHGFTVTVDRTCDGSGEILYLAYTSGCGEHLRGDTGTVAGGTKQTFTFPIFTQAQVTTFGCGTLLSHKLYDTGTGNFVTNVVDTGNYTNTCGVWTGGEPPPPAPTNCIVVLNFQNNDNVGHNFSLFKNNLVMVGSGIPVPYVYLLPGASTTVTITDPSCTGGYSLRYWELDNQFPLNPGPIPVTIYTGSNGVSPGTPPPTVITPSGPTTFGGTNSPGGTIIFNSNDTSAAKDGTLKVGFGALYDAINKGIGGLQTDIRNGTSALSNELSRGQSSAGSNDNSVVNELKSLHGDVTNDFQRFFNTATNAADFTKNLGDAATNSTIATNLATTAFGPIRAQADGVLNAFGSLPTMSGGSSSLKVNFMDTVLDLDPEVIAPGAMSWVKCLVSLVVVIVFAGHLSKLLLEALATFASAQTGGVANLQFAVLGTGGNVAGLGLAGVVIVAFIAVWVAVFTYFFSLVTPYVVAMCTSGELQGPGGAAIYLLTSALPVNLILSLAWSIVVLRMAAFKVVIIGVAASRFLLGR